MAEYARVGSSAEGSSKSVALENAKRTVLKHIETFVSTFADSQASSVSSLSLSRAMLTQAAETARIAGAGQLQCRYNYSKTILATFSF